MTSRLHRLEITNFKAFREFNLDLEGRHLLVYGRNGAGKSSLYWALYTFLQSAAKSTEGVVKYFDPDHALNLLNIHEQNGSVPNLGRIAVTLRDVATKTDTEYCISRAEHGTRNKSEILKGDLASDFITYRFFFGFSHFRNAEHFDLWPLFEKEILPFCVVDGEATTPMDAWKAIVAGEAALGKLRGRHGTRAYEAFALQVEKFAKTLGAIVDAISNEAQAFYGKHFSAGDPTPVELRLGLVKPPAFDVKTRELTPPDLRLELRIGAKIDKRPQIFLNEAKLTQIALSVRFAASMVNLHESDLKLLVLDDLLVSLDMSNRMKVVELLLSAEFEDYQKIILTHELGFFREFQRRLGSNHSGWCCLRLEGNAADQKIKGISEKDDIQKAEEYLQGHELDEAASRLRKAADTMAAKWREWADRKEIPPGKFFTLVENLRAARDRIREELPIDLYKKVLQSVPEAHWDRVISTASDDIDSDPHLDVRTKGKLKWARRQLKNMFADRHKERWRQIKLIDDIIDCTARVLNPAAHGGTPPLYEAEVQHALGLIKQLATTLPP